MSKKWIICFGSKWDSASVYTEKHLVKRFYKDGYRILWIDPIPNRNLNIKRTGSKKYLLKKFFHLIFKQFKFFYRVNKNFFVLKPFFLPNVEKFRHFNLKVLKSQVHLLLFIFRIKDYIVISARNEDVPFIFSGANDFIFIQISGDLYSDLRGISNKLKAEIIEREKRVFRRSNLILAASQRIQKKVTQYLVKDKKKVVYFPHGVEFQHFNTNLIHPEMQEIKKMGKPVAGYFGGLTHAVNQRIFLELAKNEFLVVLIGPILADFSELQENKNIIFLGPKSYRILPQYGNGFDVCIMAWEKGEWINNSNPSKTYEYLALGKPIVSVSIPELKSNLSRYVYFADTPKEFVHFCKIAIKKDTEKALQERKEFAKMLDWDYKYKKILAFIKTQDVSIFNY